MQHRLPLQSIDVDWNLTVKSVKTFETIENCPYCDQIGIHLLRAPNPEPPKVVVTADEQDEIIQRTFDGRIAVHIRPMDKYDRDDERDFEIVRICIQCRREWGVERDKSAA